MNTLKLIEKLKKAPPAIPPVPPKSPVEGAETLETILKEVLCNPETQAPPPPAFPGDPPGPSWNPDYSYLVWERAAIYEYDAGLSREESERRALEGAKT